MPSIRLDVTVSPARIQDLLELGARKGTPLMTGKDQSLDFHGSARLDAKISQMTMGWKALLLKPVDPFFSKHGGGTFVHIEIGGTRSDPHFGLDFHRKPGEDQNKQPDAGEKTQ